MGRHNRLWLKLVAVALISVRPAIAEIGTDIDDRLIASVWSGDQAALRILLRSGADPSARDESGLSASDIARELGYEEILRLLDSYPKPNALSPNVGDDQPADASSDTDTETIRLPFEPAFNPATAAGVAAVYFYKPMPEIPAPGAVRSGSVPSTSLDIGDADTLTSSVDDTRLEAVSDRKTGDAPAVEAAAPGTWFGWLQGLFSGWPSGDGRAARFAGRRDHGGAPAARPASIASNRVNTPSNTLVSESQEKLPAEQFAFSMTDDRTPWPARVEPEPQAAVATIDPASESSWQVVSVSRQNRRWGAAPLDTGSFDLLSIFSSVVRDDVTPTPQTAVAESRNQTPEGDTPAASNHTDPTAPRPLETAGNAMMAPDEEPDKEPDEDRSLLGLFRTFFGGGEQTTASDATPEPADPQPGAVRPTRRPLAATAETGPPVAVVPKALVRRSWSPAVSSRAKATTRPSANPDPHPKPVAVAIMDKSLRDGKSERTVPAAPAELIGRLYTDPYGGGLPPSESPPPASPAPEPTVIASIERMAARSPVTAGQPSVAAPAEPSSVAAPKAAAPLAERNGDADHRPDPDQGLVIYIRGTVPIEKLYLADDQRLGRAYDGGDPDLACAKRRAGVTWICPEAAFWPDGVSDVFARAETAPVETIVRYDEASASHYRATFPSGNYQRLLAHLKSRLGEPTKNPDIWSPVIGQPKQANQVARWVSREDHGRGRAVLEIRSIDDLRWMAPPDEESGVIRLFYEGAKPIYSLVTSADLRLLAVRRLTGRTDDGVAALSQ